MPASMTANGMLGHHNPSAANRTLLQLQNALPREPRGVMPVKAMPAPHHDKSSAFHHRKVAATPRRRLPPSSGKDRLRVLSSNRLERMARCYSSWSGVE